MPENRKITVSSKSNPGNEFIMKNKNKYKAIDILNIVSVTIYISESSVVFLRNTSATCIPTMILRRIKYM